MYGRRMSQDEIALENRKAEYKDFKRWQAIVAKRKGWTVGDPRLDASLIRAERANQRTVIHGIGFNMNVVRVPYRLGYQENSWDREAVHYQVKIWIDGAEKQSYVFAYSQGSGIKQFPTIREILYSFVQDAHVGAESFRDFCDNLGGDPDSIKSRKMYDACVESFEWFRLNRLYERQVNAVYEFLQEAEYERGDLESDPPAIVMMEPPTGDEDEEIPF